MLISALCIPEKGTNKQQNHRGKYASTANPVEEGNSLLEYMDRESEFGRTSSHHSSSTGASPQEEIFDRVFSGSVTPSPEPAPKISSGGPQKRSASDTEDNNSDEEGPEKKQRVVHEFACPFYKRNRTKYCHQRSCRTSGWPSVHRVKEHLYRHHMHYVCERCSTTFKAPENLKEHLRQPVACCVSAFKVPEDAGFDLETEKRLRSRKKIDGQTEIDKWTHMFQLLFPDASAQYTPSPFVDYSIQEDPYPPTGENEEALLHPEFRQLKNSNGSSTNLATIATVAVAAEQQLSAIDSRRIISDNMLVDMPGLMTSREKTRPARALDDDLYGCQMVSKTDFYEIVRDQVRAVLSTMPPPSPTHVVRRMP